MKTYHLLTASCLGLLLLTHCRKETTAEPLPHVMLPIDVAADENESHAVFEFPVVLDRVSNRVVTVHFETHALTAGSGSDFEDTSGSITFQPGETAASILVPIVVDDYLEEDEQFRVVLVGSEHAIFADGQQSAIGTIRNDDTLIGVESAGYMSAESYPGRELIWSDEFNGDQIDFNNWTYDLGASGWGNQELQNYTSSTDNSYVHNGHLMIVARQNGFHYTSARMKSIGLQEFQYGRIDVRAMLPEGQGIWPAIWMLGANFHNVGWPACGEIDIMELIGSSPNVVHGTIHYGNDYSQHQYVGQGTSIPFGQSFADEFHVFSIEWDENGITWLLDDQPYYSVNNNVTGNQNYPFDNPFFFILNVAVGGLWPGYPDASTSFPQFMAVDFVRVFQ
ncbi:MAG: family 16 glycosylhydrolase [Flavobacteriales bacterium]